MVQAISTGTFCEAKWVVSSTAGQGTHTTIAAALTSASSGDTIFIRPGTFTENISLKAGVNLTAYQCDSAIAGFSAAPGTETCNVTIVGKLSASFSGTCAISGIMLKTNSDFCLEVSGVTGTDVNLFGCYINANNNTAISVTTTNGKVNLYYCNGDIGTTGIAYFTQTAGTLEFYSGSYTNTGGSVTASTAAAAVLTLNNVYFNNPITVSTSAIITSAYSSFQGVGNTTIITTSGTGSHMFTYCKLNSGSASTVSIGAGTSVTIADSEILSSNTNAITGAGSITYGNNTFSGSSSVINTTTQVDLAIGPNIMLPTGRAIRTSKAAGNTALLQAYDVDGTSYTTFATLTANNTPTFDLAAATTIGGSTIGNVTGPGTSTDRAIATWNSTGGTALFNNSSVKISSAGALTNTTQPCFEAVVSSTISNITGDGTVYTILYDTKIFDQVTNYDTSTGIFTAPVAGRYFFQCALILADIGVAHTSLVCKFIVTSSVGAEIVRTNPVPSALSGSISTTGSIMVNMAANDTCRVQVTVTGSTKTIDIAGGTDAYNMFSGYLVC